MGATTEIAWTDATWNPMTGCTPASPGCNACYAKATHDKRHKAKLAGKKLPAQYLKPFSEIQLFPERLDVPLRWKKPRHVFVCSTGDLFHRDVPDEFIAAVFGVMAACPQHTFQVLTKRADRLADWFKWLEEVAVRSRAMFSEDPLEWRRARCLRAAGLRNGVHHKASAGDIEARGWPLPNTWLGVTVEDQERAEERIPLLLQVPAAVRFLSMEPLLGPVNVVRATPEIELPDEWNKDAPASQVFEQGGKTATFLLERLLEAGARGELRINDVKQHVRGRLVSAKTTAVFSEEDRNG